jgi:class 3 adenylate cyclase
MLDSLITKFRDAEGRSEFVIIVVCDIRDFSSFSSNREAPEIAIFISKLYEKLLSEYFVDAVFAKPTGDGLIMAFKHKSNQADLLLVAESVLEKCLKAISEYPDMLADDLMINFPLPERIGFGVARGTAFCLFAAEEAIDYSGQILNLAARLNDVARPSGIVIDGAFLEGAIPEKIRTVFRREEIYIRGISEDLPHPVFCTADVIIPESAKHPLTSHTWAKTEVELLYSKVKKLAGKYRIGLPVEPKSKSKCKVKMSFDSVLSPGHRTTYDIDSFDLTNDAEGFSISFDIKPQQQLLVKEKIKGAQNVVFSVHYVSKDAKPVAA